MSVNARTTSMTTGATKKRTSNTSAGPRNRVKLIRCRRSWARAKSGMASSWLAPREGERLIPSLSLIRGRTDVLVADDHVLAEFVVKLVYDEIRRRCRG